MSRPTLLDLYCGAGGASEGYQRAGFDVTGVDHRPQPHYPFEFIQADALGLDPGWLAGFDAIHASPPCHAYTALRALHPHIEYPDLVADTRAMLQATGQPWVIENVPRSPLLNPMVLCGTMFPGLRVLRHRLFESNVLLLAPGPCRPHPHCHTEDRRTGRGRGTTDPWTDFVTVAGHNAPAAAARDAMHIAWMSITELVQSIPPAYTEHIGQQLRCYAPQRRPAATRAP